jgi:hypothetical protein
MRPPCRAVQDHSGRKRERSCRRHRLRQIPLSHAPTSSGLRSRSRPAKATSAVSCTTSRARSRSPSIAPAIACWSRLVPLEQHRERFRPALSDPAHERRVVHGDDSLPNQCRASVRRSPQQSRTDRPQGYGLRSEIRSIGLHPSHLPARDRDSGRRARRPMPPTATRRWCCAPRGSRACAHAALSARAARRLLRIRLGARHRWSRQRNARSAAIPRGCAPGPYPMTSGPASSKRQPRSASRSTEWDT